MKMGYNNSCLLSAMLILLSKILHVLSFQSTKNSSLIPAVFVFGDSIVDPGNNNVLKTLIKCNFPPYGKDFPGHRATGRFSNGKISTDFLVSELGMKEFLPPFIGVELPPEELVSGVSFASSGSGYDPLTSTIASVLSMEEQLNFFEEYKLKLRSVTEERRAERILFDGLYVVCAGTDDLANTYFSTIFRSNFDVASYVNFMVSSASTFIQKLLEGGAKKIALIGLPPIGCLPSQRTLGGGLSRECVVARNEAASLFNSKMRNKIEEIKGQIMTDDTKIVFLDIYTVLMDIIQRPQIYGFLESTKGCCGSGKLEVAVLCNSLTAATCTNAEKYVFWDSYHPTEKAYKIIIDELLKKYLQYLS